MPRAVSNWRHIWLACSSQQTAPLRGWFLGILWFGGICFTVDLKGETLSQSHRTQRICCWRTTPSYLRVPNCEHIVPRQPLFQWHGCGWRAPSIQSSVWTSFYELPTYRDTGTSSVLSCSAIFTPNQALFVVLPSSQDMRSAQEHDQPLQNWIAHNRFSGNKCKPVLIEFEDGTRLWVDVNATPTRILAQTSLQHIAFDILHRIAHPR